MSSLPSNQSDLESSDFLYLAKGYSVRGLSARPCLTGVWSAIICTSIKQIEFWSFLYVLRQCAKPFWWTQRIVRRYLPQLFHFQIKMSSLLLTGYMHLFTSIHVYPLHFYLWSIIQRSSTVNMHILKREKICSAHSVHNADYAVGHRQHSLESLCFIHAGFEHKSLWWHCRILNKGFSAGGSLIIIWSN